MKGSNQVEKSNGNLEEASEVNQEKKAEVPVLKGDEALKFRLTEKKLNTLVHVGDLEELYYLVNILGKKQVEVFVAHYKNIPGLKKNANEKIYNLIKKANSKDDLVESLRLELITSLTDEYEGLKDRISELRKKGFDMVIESLRVETIPLKIRIYGATSFKNDFYKVKKIIHLVDEEIKSKENDLKRKDSEKVKEKKIVSESKK